MGITYWSNTYAQAYFEAFRLPVNRGESSARNLIKDLTFSASPANRNKKSQLKFDLGIEQEWMMEWQSAIGETNRGALLWLAATFHLPNAIQRFKFNSVS